MSKAWDEQNEGLPAVGEGEPQGLQELRKAYDRKDKQNKELKERLASLELKDRERVLGETLSAKGVNAKLAKFYPADREASEEKVNEWLTDNADVFGLAKADPNPQDAVSPELREAYEQFQQPGNNQAHTDLISQIQNKPMTSEAEYQQFLAFMRGQPQSVYNPGA